MERLKRVHDDALSLPAGLSTLRLRNFTSAIGDLALPAALTHLELGVKFSNPLGSVRWPRGLRSLEIIYFDTGGMAPLAMPKVDSQGDDTGLPQTLALIKIIVVRRDRFDEVADAWRALVASGLPQCRLETREWENQ